MTSENLDLSPEAPAETLAGSPTGAPHGAPAGTAAAASTATTASSPADRPAGSPVAEQADQDRQRQETAAPGPAGEGAVSFEAETLLADLGASQRVVAELTGDLQRLQAEFLNYKRRVDRDRDLVRENATFSVLAGLLPVLDDIDRAREAGDLEGGFKAVADALERAVAGLGLVKFGEPGDEFDPNLHEALMHGHSPDVTTTTCQTIISAGYRIGDRVVRPARVTVVDPEPAAQPAAGSAAQPATESTGQSAESVGSTSELADEPSNE